MVMRFSKSRILGWGISANDLPHVFEGFYRADKARSRPMGGTGLGLSIVRSICMAHSGRVPVSSSEGRRSLFRVAVALATSHRSKSRRITPNHLQQELDRERSSILG